MALGVRAGTWASSWTTQYANNPEEGGTPNFLRAHVSACAILERAQELGFIVSVQDEGEFWTKRDVKALAEKVGQWDQILAGLHGLAKDVLPPDLMPDNPMAGRPDFEPLEFKAHRLGRIGKLLERSGNLLGICRTRTARCRRLGMNRNRGSTKARCQKRRAFSIS